MMRIRENISRLFSRPLHSRHRWLLFVLIGAASFNLAFCQQGASFKPGDDYALYVHFAEAVADGHNPYALPPEYRSTVPPTFFPVGWTQSEPGKFPAEYADYPPLLMLLNSWIFRIHPVRGFYGLFLALLAASFLLYCFYAASGPSAEHAHNPYLFLAFLGLNPLVTSLWFTPTGDKVWFLFFMLALLFLRNRPYGLTVVLAIFSALKGLGLVIFGFYVLFLFATRQARPRTLLAMTTLFTLVVGASHLLWFPDWLNAYRWRADRQNLLGHASIFVPLASVGLYWSGLPKLLTAGSFLGIAIATMRRHLTLEDVLMLPIAASIVFNTELATNRLLIAIFALLLLTRNTYALATACAASVLLTTPVLEFFFPAAESETASWLILWGLTGFLGLVVIRQIGKRRQPSTALPVQNGGATPSP